MSANLPAAWKRSQRSLHQLWGPLGLRAGGGVGAGVVSMLWPETAVQKVVQGYTLQAQP